MSSEESKSGKLQEKCILKCTDPKQLFRFPAKPVMRSVWLFKLGLDDDGFYSEPNVCERHFSKKMFNSDGRLKVIAVPDINLPVESTSKKVYKDENKTTIVSVKPRSRQKTVENIETPPPQPQPQPTNVNTSSTQDTIGGTVSSWLNDNPEDLVDYQLKVGGKHMCDVIEIPQFIVVFTVIKAKQNNVIQLSDITTNNVKKPLKPTVYFTIDEATGDILDTTLAEPSLPLLPTLANKSAKNLIRKQKPTKPIQVTKNPPPTIPPSIPPSIPNEVLEVIPEQQLQQPQPIPQPQSPEKPEIDIVFYTTQGPPTRDRSIQVDFSRKPKETGIQCDIQLDNDVGQIPITENLYFMKSCFDMINNSVSSSIEECLICGEILENFVSKVKHARTHKTSPSLCPQCGDIFDNQIELKLHEKNFHFNEMGLSKPQRCPRMKCYKAFRSVEQLNDHIEEHMRTRPHKCNKCQLIFNSAMKLSCHQRALDKCLRTRGWTSRRWSKRV